jgi:hypothetical protein
MAQFAHFKEGSPTRPAIAHDHGFLDDGKGNYDPTKRRPPTDDDQQKWKWAQMVYLGSTQVREDLADASKAYWHFLKGKGANFTCDYEKFVRDDPNGQVVLASAIDDVCAGVLDVFDSKFPKSASVDRREAFSVTSNAIQVSTDFRYPYPESENWQKTLGAHWLWISANASVRSVPSLNIREVEIVVTLHAEDMYNFNPGSSDIKTGITDAENGRLEVVGLAKEFLMTGVAVRTISFTVPLAKQADNRNVIKDRKVK